MMKKHKETEQPNPDQVKELNEKLARALADYDNLKKQTAKEKEDFAKFANQTIIEQLASIWEGLDIVNQQLRVLMQTHGFEEIIVLEGDKFDPNLMEAVISEGGDAVSGILGRGYKLNGRVIKPVRVKVGAPIQSSK